MARYGEIAREVEDTDCLDTRIHQIPATWDRDFLVPRSIRQCRDSVRLDKQRSESFLKLSTQLNEARPTDGYLVS